MTRLKQKYGLLITGIVIGVIYGLSTRLIFGSSATLASATYLFLIPTVLGMIPLMFVDNEKLKSYRNIIFIPWLTLYTFFLTLLIFRIEDFICLIILSAPFFVLGTIGAVIYRFVQINRKKNKGKLLSLVLLPLIVISIESYIDKPSSLFEVKSEVLIDANPQMIWNNIVEVKNIQQEEYPSGFFNSVGIPRPISATVDQKEIGGKRIGNFEGGLTFIETITTFQKNQKISFNIKIDPRTVRQKVFDQHVLNGNYFNFVDATYELAELERGQTVLILKSSYQMTSTVNFYGKFWGDIILGDFQDRLLKVIKSRCENAQI